MKDLDLVERQTVIPVYAVIAHSNRRETLDKYIRKGNRQLMVQTDSNAEDPATESLRNLRTALRFDIVKAKNNIIMIAGLSPTVTKSIVSVNVAAVLASSKKKVLPIDGDMRRGCPHQHASQSRAAGTER